MSASPADRTDAELICASAREPEAFAELRFDGANGPGTSATMRFEACDRLPANEANRALVSLAAQHPGAVERVAPQDDGGSPGEKGDA